MKRRSLLHRVGLLAAVAATAGCTGSPNDGQSTRTDRDPSQVTTTAADDVLVDSASVAFPDDGGPRVTYRIRNDGSEDATVAVRTALTVEGADSYERTVYVDVPAGDVVTVDYEVVAYDDLPESAAGAVRRGEGSYRVFVNGEPREGL